MPNKKKYFTEEERRAAQRAASNRSYQKNKAKRAEYRAAHKTEGKKYITDYHSTPLGRATMLVNSYKQEDKKKNRGECTITPDWVVKNIFSKPCAHCGETDWTNLGCNRLDNSKPHTPDNVEPCCWECNKKLNTETKKKRVYQYLPNGILIQIWDSISEASRNGYDLSAISVCCNGKRKSHKGCIWSFIPL